MAERNYQVKIEKLPKAEMKLSFSIPAVEFEKFLNQAASDLAKDMKVSGFRAGKIPREIVEKTVGQEKFLYEGAEKAVRKVYVETIIESKIQAVGEPKVEIKKIAKGNDLEFSTIVAVLPEIELKDWKEDIKKINGEQKGDKIKIDEKEIDREVKFLASQRAKVVTVSRPAQKGDQVMVDFEVFRGNVPIENGSAKDHPVVLGEGRSIPGFEDKLIGAKEGEEKEFNLSFPKEYHEKKLAGQEATFKVKVNLVQERQIPEINDEFASGIGKFKSLEELKGNIRQGIEHEKKHKQEEEQKKRIMEKLIEKSEMELPNVLAERELAAMMSELEQDISRIGLSKEKYLEQIKTTEEKLKEGWREKEAPKRVKAALILRKIAEDEKIKPEAKEIEERANRIIEYYTAMSGKNSDEKIDVTRVYEAIKGELTNEKTFEYLMKL